MKANLDLLKLNKLIDKKLDSISEVRIGRRLRGYAIAIYQDAVDRVPQYSGHMASNLRISVNGSPVVYTKEFYTEDGRGLEHIYQRGDLDAISVADEHNRWVNSHSPSMRDEYSIEYAAGAESEYFAEIEAGSPDLRYVNQPSNAIELGFAYARRKYGLNLATKTELEVLTI